MESLAEYLTKLASDSPTPGGGSAATMVAAAGASLVAMVARICSTNPKLAPQRPLALELAARADRLRLELLAARERDEAAFARVVEATGLPKATEAEKALRRDALETALLRAAEEPLDAAELSLAVLRLSARLLEIPNRNLTSDVGCAAEFAAAALAACAYNVRINHRFMKDHVAIAAQSQRLERYEREAAALLATIRKALR